MSRKLRQTGLANTVPGSAISIVPGPGEILTVAETAALLKVPRSSIYEWTRFRGSNRGTPLPHRKIGKYIRFLRSEIDAWIVALPQAANLRKRKYVRKNQDAA